MTLSIIIICWNDREDIARCLQSVYSETQNIDFEVIVTDNGSTDGSLAYIAEHYPAVHILENRVNLGFAGANNAAFRVAIGEHVLILNPDTLIKDHAIEKLLACAVLHPDIGAFGCRMLNADGSYQRSAYPIPTVRSNFISALYLRFLGKLSDYFVADTYVNWDGKTGREVGFVAGCCLLIRRELLSALNGFDQNLFYQFEDADLCFRVWKSGRAVYFYPGAEITHVGGQNRGRYPIPVVLETQRSSYRFFHKHYGARAAAQIRWGSLLRLIIRFAAYRLQYLFKASAAVEDRLKMYRVLLEWHCRINPIDFVTSGQEPDVGCKRLAPAKQMAGNSQ